GDVRGARRDGTILARAAAVGLARRLEFGRLPVRHEPRRRHRSCDGPRDAAGVWRCARLGGGSDVDIGHATVRATRLTYVGELGWELYVPVEFAVGVYDDLLAAGADLDVHRGGYYAIDSLRLDKGYRAFGRELTPDFGPVEAGLLF